MNITWYGQSAFMLEGQDARVLIDPFLTGNPLTNVAATEVEPDAILLTHGHEDHIGDAAEIAKRRGCPVLAIREIAVELEQDGVEVRDPNLGGTVTFPWGTVKLVPAMHTSTTPKGTVAVAAGLIITIDGITVYHAGDTALCADLEMTGRFHDIDVAILPIGGHYTMDRHDAAIAATMLGAGTVIPCHYNTFPIIEADAQAFKRDVEERGAGTVVVLEADQPQTVGAKERN